MAEHIPNTARFLSVYLTPELAEWFEEKAELGFKKAHLAKAILEKYMEEERAKLPAPTTKVILPPK